MEEALNDNQIVELFRSGSDSALSELQKKYGAHCRIFKEVGSFRQISLFEVEPEY